MADERLGVEARQLLLADREGDDRNVFGRNLLVAELLVERHVGVAVDGRDDRGLLAGRAEPLDRGDAGLPVGVAERRVVDRDVRGLHALGQQVGLEDLVGRARIDVVGAFEHPPLHADVLHQVVHRGNRLLVRRRAGVDDVLRRLLAFVLHGIEEQAVVLLEHRQDRLSRHRRPAAEHHGDLVLLQQLRAPSRRRAASSDAGSTTTASSFLPSSPPFLFCSSIIIRTVSFSVVSLMAIVPESECSTPTLMVSCAAAAWRRSALAATTHAARYIGLSFIKCLLWIITSESSRRGGRCRLLIRARLLGRSETTLPRRRRPQWLARRAHRPVRDAR